MATMNLARHAMPCSERDKARLGIEGVASRDVSVSGGKTKDVVIELSDVH